MEQLNDRRIHLGIDMRPGQYWIRVAARDADQFDGACQQPAEAASRTSEANTTRLDPTLHQ